MNGANNILDELRNMGSKLGDLPRAMPYSIPAGYFQEFAADTQNIIKEINKPDAAPTWGKGLPYHTPAGYFENLAANIVSNAASENVLPGLPAAVPFDVPQGYFDNLPAQLLAAAKASEPAVPAPKTIPLKRIYTIQSIRWAAAAILLIFIGFGGVFFFQQPSSQTDQILASVPGNELQDYFQHTYRIDVDQVVNSDLNNLQADSKEIIEYLNETGWDVTE